MHRICVFTGTSFGRDERYLAAAHELGQAIAARGWGLVYGGASVGLMGAVADAALAAGGEAVGVIPRFIFEKETAHRALTELRVVDTMHERKALMEDLSDGFVTLPGGLGTMEELFDVWSWGQLDQHKKPNGLLNVGGFYSRLLDFLGHMTGEGFMKPEHLAMLQVADRADDLLELFLTYQPPTISKFTPA